MTSLIKFDLQSLDLGVSGNPLEGREVEGEPLFTTWQIDDAGGGLRTGVWEVAPGAYRSIKGASWEFCTILSGVSEIIEDGGQPIIIKAGDAFVMQPRFVGIWRCVETTRKIWAVREGTE
jgi:uncharacterized protein